MLTEKGVQFLLSGPALGSSGYLIFGIVGKPYSEDFCLFVLFSLSWAEPQGDALQTEWSREFATGS